jgi:hypothetical protein
MLGEEAEPPAAVALAPRLSKPTDNDAASAELLRVRALHAKEVQAKNGLIHFLQQETVTATRDRDSLAEELGRTFASSSCVCDRSYNICCAPG